jgi:hypothetical protein
MPLNGSGTYAAPASSFNPAVTTTTVNSTDWAALLADITTALSTALYKDGQPRQRRTSRWAGSSSPDLGLDLQTATRFAVAALNKAIYGLTYANNGADSIDIAAGGAMDATGAYWMTAAALTKNITAAWAVGTAAGMLDTGAVGNSDYYLWLIARSDTGVVDYLGSLSSTAPTMPANYDFKRLIGWFKRVGATNVAFHTYESEGGGLEMNWDVPTLDVSLTNTLTTARRTDAIKVPLNFSVQANLNVQLTDVAGVVAHVCCPDQTDAAPSATVAPLGNFSMGGGAMQQGRQITVRTSATGTIAARADTATVDFYGVATIGFRWARRN